MNAARLSGMIWGIFAFLIAIAGIAYDVSDEVGIYVAAAVIASAVHAASSYVIDAIEKK